MERLTDFAHAVGVLALLFALLQAACGESYRVEPLLLEGREVAARVVASYPEQERIREAETALARFLKELGEGRCESAWEILTMAYRQRFAGVAGGEEEARSLFCDGYRVEGEMLVKGEWRNFMVGDRSFYLTPVPPELGLQAGTGQELYHLVQKDGTYRSILLVRERGGLTLEPF